MATSSSRSCAAAVSVAFSVPSTTSAIAEEGQAPVQERGDGDLVGGVQDARSGAPGLTGRPRQREARERLLVRGR